MKTSIIEMACIMRNVGNLRNKLCFSTDQLLLQNRQNAWRASLGKISRAQYLRKYPMTLVRPDGSSILVRSPEPQEVAQLAVDLKSLSDDERRQRLAARKPKARKIKQEVIDDNFNSSDYMDLFKRK